MFQYFAQVPSLTEDFALSFLSGPQFFIALIAGVVMAFAFQFILSNLSVAIGISAGINPADTDDDYSRDKERTWGKKLRKIEAKVGTTTLFIVNTAVFIACFLAVKLTLIHDAGLAAIVSVVIWSVYFLLLVWLSSQAIASVVGTVGSAANTGLQGVVGTVATALSGRAASKQVTDTVEASVDVVKRELQSALSSDRLRENLEGYVSNIRLPQIPQLDLNNVPNQAMTLLSNANLPAFENSDLLNIIRSATPEDLESGKLRERLTQLLGIKLPSNGNGQANGGLTNGESQPQQGGVGLRERTMQLGTDTLIATLTGRSGLAKLNPEDLTKVLNALGFSDISVEKVTRSLNAAREQLGQQANQVGQQASHLGQQAGQAVKGLSRQPAFTIRSDVENYLLNSPGWYLRPENLDRGFREVLFDPEANAGLVRQQLEQLNRSYFVGVLNRREGVVVEQINDIADELEVVRQEVLDTVRAAEEQERIAGLRHRVETYLKSAPKEALMSESIQQDFTALLADPDATYEMLGNRLLQFDRDALTQMLLAGRQDLNPEETERILNDLEGARDRFLNQSQETWNQLQAEAGEFRQQVERYLTETNPTELTPTAIQQTLQQMLQAPERGFGTLRAGLGQLNRTSLQQVLSQRQDLSSQQVNQLIDQFESVRDEILHTPRELAEQAREQVDRLTTQIADYLRSTNLEELNPEGIQRDLQQLLNDPQAGVSALGERLSHVDRDTLVRLLSQRQDLSEEQVNRAIDQVFETLQSIARSPREIATRTRDRVQDFTTDLTDYLRNTNREELNPEGIQRDLQRLFKHPKAGVEQLSDRLSQVDRGTLVSLLTQRQDVTEEEANRIVDQVLDQAKSIQQQLLQPVRAVKDQVQNATDKVTGNVRNYLDSLDLPELNYDNIQRDVRKLFDDPEAGFDALKDRLSQFDRETLVTLLTSRSNLSEEQVNQVIDQIEAARDSVLQRAERVQTKAQERVRALKHQAKEQAEEVQKTAASAAWWVFGTAITSVATAAIAGILAAAGVKFLG
ncbi:MFS transporter [Oscillatoria sp. FACHB-1407]|uniref:MFS transporter n=1 Tax=Oscillatoria sp. FACHB-1407 TaxID=2692847 RepID=UPI001681D304|nr:MFS transporter [Oscillatoria sp. FACHB-1407]MBD2462633.1 MFS transporter [Oscillatoria sp. FACHB-1407]